MILRTAAGLSAGERGENAVNIRRFLALLLCAVLCVTLLTSCGGPDVKAFYFAVNASAGTFDPTIASDTTARIIVRNCFEGLVYTDENGNIRPGVASSWTVSDDGLTYTFRLREDAQWHLTSNAKEQLEGKLPEDFDLSLTAADFEFGLKRALDPAMASPDAFLLSDIAGARAVLAGEAPVDTLGIKAVSEHELTVTLSRPQPDLLYVLSEPLCMPCSETFFNACGGRYGLFIRYSLSNGPFYLSYFDDQTYRISKNPDYHGDCVPAADVVRLYVDAENASVAAGIKKGDYAGARFDEARFETLDMSRKMSDITVADKTRSFVLNAKSEVLADASIRMAFILATDTAKFAEASGRTPVYDPVPAAAADASYVGQPSYNEEKARDILNAALEKTGEKSVTVTLKCEERFELPIKKQMQYWQKIFGTSFIINVESMSAEQLAADVKKGDYDIAFYPVGTPSFSAARFFFGFLSGSADNIFGTENEELDAAIKAFAGTEDAKRSEAYAELVSELSANAVLLPVWSEDTHFVCADDVSGVILLPGSDSLYFYKVN